MSAKRHLSEEQRLELKEERKFKNILVSVLSSKEKDELLEIIAKKLKLI